MRFFCNQPWFDSSVKRMTCRDFLEKRCQEPGIYRRFLVMLSSVQWFFPMIFCSGFHQSRINGRGPSCWFFSWFEMWPSLNQSHSNRIKLLEVLWSLDYGEFEGLKVRGWCVFATNNCIHFPKCWGSTSQSRAGAGALAAAVGLLSLWVCGVTCVFFQIWSHTNVYRSNILDSCPDKLRHRRMRSFSGSKRFQCYGCWRSWSLETPKISLIEQKKCTKWARRRFFCVKFK